MKCVSLPYLGSSTTAQLWTTRPLLLFHSSAPEAICTSQDALTASKCWAMRQQDWVKHPEVVSAPWVFSHTGKHGRATARASPSENTTGRSQAFWVVYLSLRCFTHSNRHYLNKLPLFVHTFTRQRNSHRHETISTWFSNSSRDGDSTTFLSSLIQCFTNLPREKLSLIAKTNLSWHSIRPCLLVQSLVM